MPPEALQATPNILKLEKVTHNQLLGLDRKRTLVAAALSPIEVHGPHLPLGQDLFQAVALTEKALERLARKRPDWTFVVYPPIPVATDCLLKLGSLSFPAAIVRDVAYHLFRPLARHGFSRLVYTSFHGGPRHNLALEAAATRISREFKTGCISLLSAAMSKPIEGHVYFQAIENTPGRRISLEQIKRDVHAGYVETSIGLHLWPQLVKDGWERLPESVIEGVPAPRASKQRHSLFRSDAPARWVERARRILARLKTMPRELDHSRPETYRGYPALSSTREGRDLFEHLTGITERILEEFLERGPEMPCHSPLWPFRWILLNPVVNKILDYWMYRNAG